MLSAERKRSAEFSLGYFFLAFGCLLILATLLLLGWFLRLGLSGRGILVRLGSWRRGLRRVVILLRRRSLWLLPGIGGIRYESLFQILRRYLTLWRLKRVEFGL